MLNIFFFFNGGNHLISADFLANGLVEMTIPIPLARFCSRMLPSTFYDMFLFSPFGVFSFWRTLAIVTNLFEAIQI